MRSLDRKCFALYEGVCQPSAITIEGNTSSQGWRSLVAELAMKDDNDRLPTLRSAAAAGYRKVRKVGVDAGTGLEKHLVHHAIVLDIDRPFDMTAVVFVIESTIENVERLHLILEVAIEERSHLQVQEGMSRLLPHWRRLLPTVS